MSKVSPPRKLVERNVPSGLSVIWKLWRHCLCRNGFYPVIVAPFVTAAFVFDVYASTGCRFIHLDVGMEPTNKAWNQTQADLGLFFYRETIEASSSNFVMNTFHPECQAYDSVFNEFFIKGDKTWKMSQILAFISAGGGCIATAVIWMMIITPLPSCFIWPGILLPAVLIEFLTGSAKFLIYDTQICKGRLWIPQGENMQSQRAESCSLSIDSILSIAGSVLSLLSVLMVCLRAPKRRILDDSYGMRYKDVDNDMQNLWTSTMDDSACNSYGNEVESQARGVWNSPAKVRPTTSLDIESIIRKQMSKESDDDLVQSDSKPTKKRQQSKNVSQSKKHSNIGEIDVKKLREVDPDIHNSHDVQKMPKEQVYTDISDENLSLRSMPKSIRSGRSSKSKIPQDTNYAVKEDASFDTSKLAPSDEAACFAFKSPLKSFKDNFSPLKSTKSKKDPWPALQETKAYDENKIMKCIGDLEHSFTQS